MTDGRAAVNHEDIDFLWDNPEARVGRKDDILKLIGSKMADKMQPSTTEGAQGFTFDD